MRIEAVETAPHDLALARPYTIAFRTIDAVEVASVRLYADDGTVGFGTATPESFVTGESGQACRTALQVDDLQWLVGREVAGIDDLDTDLRRRMPETPAARAAVDIAFHDLLAKARGVALVDMFGRCHQTLPTSVTIGILPSGQAMEQAREHVAAGFRILKIKLGHSLEEDVERLRALRTEFPSIGIRVDPNQGYDTDQLFQFAEATAALDIEFIEQPMKAAAIDAMRALPQELRLRVAADESLLDATDAESLLQPPQACGIFNIKLMKCGGIGEARRIAAVAERSSVELMWGCMDESVIGIAAALHTALACPATRYLDLDGSFDLARDLAAGGFRVSDGCLHTLDEPGLGVRWTG